MSFVLPQYSTVPNGGVPLNSSSQFLHGKRRNPSSVMSLYHTQAAGSNPPVDGDTVANRQATTTQTPLYQALQGSKLQPGGMVAFNEPVIQTLLKTPKNTKTQVVQALPRLIDSANTHGAILPAVTGIYILERLAEDGMDINDTYPLLSKLDTHPHPLVPIYLAGAYAEMTRPEPFGWAIMQMMQLSIAQLCGTQPPQLWKRHEEMGKLLAKQLKQSPQLWQQLQPWLNPPQPATSPAT